MKRLILGTRNAHKVFEIGAACAAVFEVVLQPSTVPDVEETGRTFMENAIIKAVHTSWFVEDLVLADDSGLCVDALNGRPGVYSARYAPGEDSARIRKVLEELRDIPDERRKAAFICSLALARKGQVLWTGEGRVDGRISRTPSGANGFGYDPIFWIPEFTRTMAELTIEEKNRTSHRGRAIQLLVRHFAASDSL